jgi:hypothetical protein
VRLVSVADEKFQKIVQELEAHNVQQIIALQDELLHAIAPTEADSSVPLEASQLETIESTTHALEMLSTLRSWTANLFLARKTFSCSNSG